MVIFPYTDAEPQLSSVYIKIIPSLLTVSQSNLINTPDFQIQPYTDFRGITVVNIRLLILYNTTYMLKKTWYAYAISYAEHGQPY